jgi:mono/diheme cytochrome c family protein
MQHPDMLFLRDSTGKQMHADTRERIVHGLDAADSHHETNSICYEPGGAVYFSDGVFHRTNVETIDGPIRNANGAIYRFEPRTSRFERYVPYGFANPHGRVFDYWGNDIITDATGNASYFAPAFSGHLDNDPNVGSDNKLNRAHPKMKEFWNRPSRPCPGTNILSSRHFPDDWQGQFLDTNVIGFQGIFRAKVSEDGSGLKGETIEPLVEGLLGDDEHEGNPNFRPSGIAVAPDGSLYFMDWSQMLIGHLQHHLRDPNRHHDHGRIYRITYPSRPLLTPKPIYGQSIPALLDLLKEHEDNVRQRAKIELDTHDTSEVIAAVDRWEKALDKSDKDYEHNRLEALWVHQWHNVMNPNLLNAVLKSPEPRARAQAVRVLCYWMDRVPNAMALLDAAIKDSAPRVRLEAVRALSFVKGQDVPKAFEMAKTVMLDKDYYIDYCFRETVKQLTSLPEGKGLADKDPLLVARLRAAPDAKFGPTRKKLTADEQKAYDLGKEVFARDAHCATCHQPDGKGVENTYPPLAKSEWLEDKDRVIKIVLKGLYGELKFQGKTYGPAKNTPPMVGFAPLANDDEIAAVISYVRQSFGNDLDFVKPEEVKRIREQTKDRNIFYMVDDILKENPLGPKEHAAAAKEKPAAEKGSGGK